jgi:hypothetical protein
LRLAASEREVVDVVDLGDAGLLSRSPMGVPRLHP